MIDEPPFWPGVDQVSDAEPFDQLDPVMVGAEAVVIAVSEAEGDEATPVPAGLIAETLKT